MTARRNGNGAPPGDASFAVACLACPRRWTYATRAALEDAVRNELMTHLAGHSERTALRVTCEGATPTP